MSSNSEDDYRLPMDVKPRHYDLFIQTDLEQLVFAGFAKIDLNVIKGTSRIVLNSSGLTIGSVTLSSDALSSDLTAVSVTIDKERERISFEWNQYLPAGSMAQLQIDFQGELTDALMGYYHSSFEVDGKTKQYALTHFEPTAARRAFPCWDEPLIKAEFALSAITRNGTVALGNMPVISEHPAKQFTDSLAENDSRLKKWISGLGLNNSWKVSKFGTTPLMSTYIIAYANGEFEYLESCYKSPISGITRPLRIYATKDHIDQARFALEVKAKAMPLYEEMFDIEYPLPKLDTLISADFSIGAMENWGLITGRSSIYCFDEKANSIVSKIRTATTQSHEVSHQWFGNITTMQWWDNVYLKEGFATLMGEIVLPGKIWPEWNMNKAFVVDHLERALILDAKLSSHPIEVPCPDANQANQIFDALSYSKAASVLRMLSNFVGEEIFLKGVSIYLKRHLYGNSVSKDLWDGISEAYGKDVTAMMQTWVGKIGYPVLSVSETDEGIHIRQDRFLESGPASPEDNRTIWTIPLSLVMINADGSAAIDSTIILDKREQIFKIDSTRPFKINAGSFGVYRVKYEPIRLRKIAKIAAKDDTAFRIEDRMGLLQDAIALAKAGYGDTSLALDLVEAFRDERDYNVWNSMLDVLLTIRGVWFENEQIKENINVLLRSLLSPLVEKLGYEATEKDSPETKQLRALAIAVVASAGERSVIQELRRRFASFLETGDDSIIPSDLTGSTYAQAIKHGDIKDYEAVVNIFRNPRSPDRRLDAIRALGATQDPTLAVKTLRLTEEAKTQDLPMFFSSVASNKSHIRIAVSYFKDNYDQLAKRFEGNYNFQRVVDVTFKGLASMQDYEETSEFFKTKNTSKYRMVLEQTLEGIRANSEWISRCTTEVEQWFDEHN